MIGEVQHDEAMRPVVQRSSTYYQLVRPTLEVGLDYMAKRFGDRPYLNIGQPLLRELAVLAPSHRSNWESPLMATIGYHEARLEFAFLAKEKMWTKMHRVAEQMKTKYVSAEMAMVADAIAKLDVVAKYGVELGGGFPVDQDHPNFPEVLAWGHYAIQAGHSAVIFPEGTRLTKKKAEKDNLDITQIQKLHRGATYIALQENVPVQPIAIWGTQDLDPRPWTPQTPIVINIGEPLSPENYDASSPVRASRLMKIDLEARMQTLLDEAREAQMALAA